MLVVVGHGCVPWPKKGWSVPRDPKNEIWAVPFWENREFGPRTNSLNDLLGACFFWDTLKMEAFLLVLLYNQPKGGALKRHTRPCSGGRMGSGCVMKMLQPPQGALCESSGTECRQFPTLQELFSVLRRECGNAPRDSGSIPCNSFRPSLGAGRQKNASRGPAAGGKKCLLTPAYQASMC